jgi:hypothetical protein
MVARKKRKAGVLMWDHHTTCRQVRARISGGRQDAAQCLIEKDTERGETGVAG